MESEIQSEMKNLDNIVNEENEENCVFFCPICEDIPEFIFDDFPKIKVICKNASRKHIEQLNFEINNLNKEESKKNLDNIIQKFSYSLFLKVTNKNNNGKENNNGEINFKKLKDEDIKKLKNLKLICQVHKLPFKYYCNDCKKHQCKECRFGDLSKEKCKHENCIDFIQIECDIKDQIKEIKELMDSSNIKNKSYYDNFFQTLDAFQNFQKFVDILINHYKKLRHYSIIKSISNLYGILSKGNKKKEKEELEMDATKVFSPFRLNPDEKEKITEIKFSNFCVNMNIFKKNFDFSNLIKLSLKNNNISDISILKEYDFANLLTINLNSNKLGDSMIEIIDKLKAPLLKSLNLSFNNFTDFKLFKAIEHFPLEVFKLEENPFNEEVDTNKINEEYNFLLMKKLYLSNGVFCNETVGLLKKFKFSILEVLDISSNNIESLKFLHYLQFINKDNKKMNKKDIPLKEIYLNNGVITDNELDYFKKFPKLEKIELKNNLIKNHNNLKELKNYLEQNNKNNVEIIAWENPIEN